MAEFTPLDTHLHQHDPHAGDGRGPEGQLRAPRRADGPRPGRVRALEPLPEVRPGRSHSGRTATASCSRTATPRCCSTRSSTSPASGTSIDDGKVLDEPSLPMDQLKQFRQLGSKTPGHPECELTAGVETTTGPLGQGIGNAVGMAIAQKWRAARYGQPGFEALFDHHVYAICGDGCMMEGVATEAASLAGHLKLGNLTLIYDDNSITIDGKTSLAFSEDVAARFAAYGWNVLRVNDGNDLDCNGEGPRRGPKHDRPADAHLPEDAHRLRRAEQAGHALRPRRTARRRGDQAHEEGLRLAGGRAVPRAGRRLRPLPGRHRQARRGGARRVAEAVRRVQGEVPDLAAELETMEKRDLPDGLGQGHPELPGRREGARDARQFGAGAERDREERAVDRRRLGGPEPVDQDVPEVRGGRDVHRRRTPAGETSTSASASTPWARS